MFSNSVSLRINGDFESERISQRLGFIPSYLHKKGDKDRFGDVLTSDMWILDAPFDRDRPIDEKFGWFVELFDGKHDILREIKTSAKVDIFCGITTSDQSGFSLSHESLSIFCDLKINLEISLNS